MRAEQVDLVARTLGGPPAVVLVAGVAGMGKSWLVREVLQHPLLRSREVTVVEDVSGPLPDAECLLVTYRPEEVPIGQMADFVSKLRAPMTALEVVVEPLSLTEIAALASVPPDVAAVLLAETGGVPRAIEEVLDLLPTGYDRHDVAAIVASQPVPAITRHTALARFARLSLDAKSVAEVACVAPGQVTEQLLGAVTGLAEDQLCEALTEALRNAVLFEHEDGYAAQHNLGARAIYEALPGPHRRRLHLKLAIHFGDQPVLAAEHYRAAGRPEDWRRNAEIGAEQAIATGDVAAAVRLMRDVLAGPGLERSELTRIGLKFGVATEHAAEYDRFVAVLRELVDDPAIPAPALGELRLNLGLLLGNQAGDSEAGERELMRAIPDLAHRPSLQARAMSALSVPGTNLRPVADNVLWMRRTEEIVDQITDSAIRIAVEVNIATTLMALGMPKAFSRAGVLFHEPATREESLQLRRGCLNAADSSTWLGHYRRARRFVRRGRDLSSDTTYASVGLDSVELLLDWFTGSWSELDTRAELLARNKDVPRLAAEATFVAAALNLTRGGGPVAAKRLEEIVNYTVYEVSPAVHSLSGGVLIRWSLAQGNVPAAQRCAERVLAAVTAKELWAWASDFVPAYVELMLHTEQRQQAKAILDVYADGVANADAPLATAALVCCEALMSGDPATFRRAEQLYAELPRPYDALRMREAAGTDTDLLAALTGYEAMGAESDAARCRNLLRQLGIEPPRLGRRRGYGEELSPRELEVVKLAAAGSTNAEIAAALYLSPRTVEQHVAHALRKLGLKSRREL